MIALKDCKWKVSFSSLTTPSHLLEMGETQETYYYWCASSDDNYGLQVNPQQYPGCLTLSGSRRNFKRFAKLNKIPKKNWRYAE